MAAADKYQIMCGTFCAYIARPSKRNPNRMLDDRRKISDEEILYLIDWFLDKKASETDGSISFFSDFRHGKKIVLRFEQED